MSAALRLVEQEKEPLVSVIMPAYNKGPFIPEAVLGLAQQNYPKLELLIRDDGSTDNTQQVLSTIQSFAPNIQIKIFNDSNKGASYSRNFLIEKTSSPVVVLMDADDLMLPNFIHKAVEAMREHKARVVFSDIDLCGDKTGEWCPPPFDAYTIRYGNGLSSLSMIDKDLWSEVEGYDTGLPFNEDWSFFIRVAQKTSAFHKLPEKYFKYRQMSGGLYQTYILDNWVHNLALVKLANSDLYPVEEVFEALEKLRTAPPHWVKKLTEHFEKHPSAQTPYLVLAITAETRGDKATEQALIERAYHLKGHADWLIALKFGRLLFDKDTSIALSLLHKARTLRPDVLRFVKDDISTLIERLPNSKGA